MPVKDSESFNLAASGLSPREALVWRTLATNKPLNISQLAQATKLHRPAMYALLPSLIQKELVKEVTQQRRVFYTITSIAKMRAYCAAQNKALASYFSNQDNTEPAPEVTVFRGADIRRVWETIAQELPKASVFYRYDGYSPNTSLATYVPENYISSIQQKKFERFVITNQGLRKTVYKKRIECASRMLPNSFDAFEHGVTQMIFNDKIAFIDLNTETAFILQNKAIAQYHTRLFQFLFKQLPE